MVALYGNSKRLIMEHYGYNVTVASKEDLALTFVKV